MKIFMDIDKKKAIAAGLEPITPQIVAVTVADLTRAERDELVHHTGSGVPDGADAYIRYADVAEATIDTLRQALADSAARRAENEAKRVARAAEQAAADEKMIVDWLAKKDEDKIALDYNHGFYRLSYPGYMSTNDPRVRAEFARLEPIADAKTNVYKLQKLEQERDKEKLEQDKHLQLTSAVHAYGTATQIARWADGVMPISEAIGLIRDHALEPLTSAGYAPLESDMYHNVLVGVDIEESDKKTLDDTQYVAAKKIRDIMPEWNFSYVQQYYVDPDTEETVKRVYIRLSKKIGLFTIDCDVEI